MNLKRLIEEKELNMKVVSESTNIPYSTLVNMDKNKDSIKIVNLKKLASFFDMSLDTLYEIIYVDNEENKYAKSFYEQKQMKLKGNIYHKAQVLFAYNSNHIEGSRLSEEQTREIFERNTITKEGSINVDDIIETRNHFILFDQMIDTINVTLSEQLIKSYHKTLKTNTQDSQKDWFNVGEYKLLDNFIGDTQTTKSSLVAKEMKELIINYNKKELIVLEDIIDFHVKFEKIHPFQDGNGRIGRIIMFKECLKHNIVPFIVLSSYKEYYYRGLKEYSNDKTYLIDTIKSMQDYFIEQFNYLLNN